MNTPLRRAERSLSSVVVPQNILFFYEKPLEKEHSRNMYLSVHYFSPFVDNPTNTHSPISVQKQQQFNSCTHYYHSKKFETLGAEKEMRQILSISSPEEAYERSKMLEVPYFNIPKWKDWEERKVDVMRTAIRLKFEQNPTLMEKLLMTGDKSLIEDHPHDSFWFALYSHE